MKLTKAHKFCMIVMGVMFLNGSVAFGSERSNLADAFDQFKLSQKKFLETREANDLRDAVSKAHIVYLEIAQKNGADRAKLRDYFGSEYPRASNIAANMSNFLQNIWTPSNVDTLYHYNQGISQEDTRGLKTADHIHTNRKNCADLMESFTSCKDLIYGTLGKLRVHCDPETQEVTLGTQAEEWRDLDHTNTIFNQSSLLYWSAENSLVQSILSPTPEKFKELCGYWGDEGAASDFRSVLVSILQECFKIFLLQLQQKGLGVDDFTTQLCESEDTRAALRAALENRPK